MTSHNHCVASGHACPVVWLVLTLTPGQQAPWGGGGRRVWSRPPWHKLVCILIRSFPFCVRFLHSDHHHHRCHDYHGPPPPWSVLCGSAWCLCCWVTTTMVGVTGRPCMMKPVHVGFHFPSPHSRCASCVCLLFFSSLPWPDHGSECV